MNTGGGQSEQTTNQKCSPARYIHRRQIQGWSIYPWIDVNVEEGMRRPGECAVSVGVIRKYRQQTDRHYGQVDYPDKTDEINNELIYRQMANDTIDK